MRILLVSSAFSGLTQRFYTELKDAHYDVSVELHSGDEQKLREGVALYKPDLIICPFLTKKIPVDIYTRYKCLIIHPGIRGDRGPSSLDWAIQQGETLWGVTLLEADAEMDAGAIWSYREFPMRDATKSSLFNREVTQAAVDCLWEALTYFQCRGFKPEPLDYHNPIIQGRLMPMMKQTDRAIDWTKDNNDDIVRKIHAADGRPGVLDQIHGQAYYLFNAHKASGLTGKPGQIIAIAEGAICRATVDGAVWIGHLQAQLESGKGVKLPATIALGKNLALENKGVMARFRHSIKCLDIDYYKQGRQLPVQEVWFEIKESFAYLYFEFHNGGMSTTQCQKLLTVYRHLAQQNVKAIVLMGGEDVWSNGIHLNHIENATDPADESWKNINAIDDLVYQIINTPDKLTIAAVRGNAGAGGVILALAADRVYVRDGVVLNPHYRNMGGLFGSEYWTYLLPKRVGIHTAVRLTEECLPLSAKEASQIGMVNQVLDKQSDLFIKQVEQLTRHLCENPIEYQKHLARKALTRETDEAQKPLHTYRSFELVRMYQNFYQENDYHEARYRFVYKQSDNAGTPLNIAVHRQQAEQEPLNHHHWTKFFWHDLYQLQTRKMDTEHEDIFKLANRINALTQVSELRQHFVTFKTTVEKHFRDEEKMLFRLQSSVSSLQHCHEHNAMLDLLTEMQTDIEAQQWVSKKMDRFMNTLGKHIMETDKEMPSLSVSH